jgi:16S rRNA (guanine966-N2)-methyltransferase
MDIVRQAVFSSIAGLVEGARVLDLFAGAGAYGLEALSRGAEAVTFVDADRKAIDALNKVIARLRLTDFSTVLNTDADRAVRRFASVGMRFGIVFVDPPYSGGSIADLFETPGFLGLVEPGGVLITERSSRSGELAAPADFANRFSRKYGQTVIDIFERAEAPS